MERDAYLLPLRELPRPTDIYRERAGLMRAAWNAGCSITEIARAASCDRKDVYRAIRREEA